MKRAVVRFAPILLAALLPGMAGPKAQWIKDGSPVCPSARNQWYASPVSDAAGGAIIVWWEARSGSPGDCDIYAQRIDRNGWALWAPEGVCVCAAPGAQEDPCSVADGEGGAIIVWRDARGGTFDIYAQRLDAAGLARWTANGAAVAAERHGQYLPSVARDNRGGFIVAWADDRDCNRQIYCQRLDGNGNALWTANGIAVCPTMWWQDQPAAISDASAGAIIVWEDERGGFPSSFIYAQRIDGGGGQLWAPGGAAISWSSGSKRHVRCIEDGCGGAFAAWSVGENGSMNVCAQRIDSTGAIWAAGDAPLGAAPRDQDEPDLVLDGAGGAIVAWHDRRDGCDDIYAQRIGGSGEAKWAPNGRPVRCNPPSEIAPWTIPQLIPDGAGGAVIAWQWGSGTSTDYDIFAQRIDDEGTLLWSDTGVEVCAAAGGQYYPRIIPNGEGGGIIAWRDMRRDTIGAVYAMRITANGETVATLLMGFAARAEGTGIVIEWRLSEIDARSIFTVLRAEGDGAYGELAAGVYRRDGLSFSLFDDTCRRGIAYRYRVDVETAGLRTTLFESEPISLPSPGLALAQNYPNPFNPATTIRYDLPRRVRARLDIFDCAGRRVARLVDGERDGGPHTVMWDGADAAGAALNSGIYFYRLTAGAETISRSMVLMR